jgi:hypothetical protein
MFASTAFSVRGPETENNSHYLFESHKRCIVFRSLILFIALLGRCTRLALSRSTHTSSLAVLVQTRKQLNTVNEVREAIQFFKAALPTLLDNFIELVFIWIGMRGGQRAGASAI